MNACIRLITAGAPGGRPAPPYSGPQGWTCICTHGYLEVPPVEAPSHARSGNAGTRGMTPSPWRTRPRSRPPRPRVAARVADRVPLRLPRRAAATKSLAATDFFSSHVEEALHAGAFAFTASLALRAASSSTLGRPAGGLQAGGARLRLRPMRPRAGVAMTCLVPQS